MPTTGSGVLQFSRDFIKTKKIDLQELGNKFEDDDSQIAVKLKEEVQPLFTGINFLIW